MDKPTYPPPTVSAPRRGFKPEPTDDGLLQLLEGCVAAGECALSSKTYATAHRLATDRGLLRDPGKNPVSLEDTAVALASMVFHSSKEDYPPTINGLYFALAAGWFESFGCTYDLYEAGDMMAAVETILRRNGIDWDHFTIDPDEVYAEMRQSGDSAEEFLSRRAHLESLSRRARIEEVVR